MRVYMYRCLTETILNLNWHRISHFKQQKKEEEEANKEKSKTDKMNIANVCTLHSLLVNSPKIPYSHLFLTTKLFSNIRNSWFTATNISACATENVLNDSNYRIV